MRSFCEALGITGPVVFGHSMGGFVAMLYGIRHPGHASGIVLQSTSARHDLDRLVEGFRRVAGDRISELARRSYGDGDPISEAEWVSVFAAFGPNVPSSDELARRNRNLELAPYGKELLRRFDVVGQLKAMGPPALVCVGDLDPVTPLEAAEEIFEAMPEGRAQLQVFEGAGHFPWKDAPDEYWEIIGDFIESVGSSYKG